MLTPIEDFENQLLLSSFALASHALRLLHASGQLDDIARRSISNHLAMLSEKALAVPNEELRAVLLGYLDVLVQILPPPQSDPGLQ